MEGSVEDSVSLWCEWMVWRVVWRMVWRVVGRVVGRRAEWRVWGLGRMV